VTPDFENVRMISVQALARTCSERLIERKLRAFLGTP
jgi:hypothetical protein